VPYRQLGVAEPLALVLRVIGLNLQQGRSVRGAYRDDYRASRVHYRANSYPVCYVKRRAIASGVCQDSPAVQNAPRLHDDHRGGRCARRWVHRYRRGSGAFEHRDAFRLRVGKLWNYRFALQKPAPRKVFSGAFCPLASLARSRFLLLSDGKLALDHLGAIFRMAGLGARRLPRLWP